MKQKIILLAAILSMASSNLMAQGNWVIDGESVSPNVSAISSSGTVTASGDFTWVSSSSFVNDNHLVVLSYALPPAVNVASGTPSLTYTNNTPVQGASFTMNAGGWTCNLPAGAVFAPGTKVIFKIANLEIKDDKAYTNQQLTHSVSFVAGPQNESYIDNVATATFNTMVSTPLPLNLLNFDASLVTKNGADKVELNWTTSTEENTDFFVVQRSINSEDWKDVLQVESKGNSQETSYKDFDNAPLFGLSYYRLQEVDQDGNSAYSEMRSIERSSDNFLSIYPNPTQEKVQIECFINADALIDIKVLSVDGKVVLSNSSRREKGMNSFDLNLSELATGTYEVNVYNNNKLFKSGKIQKN